MSQPTALELIARQPADTLELGRRLAQTLHPLLNVPLTIGLRGELGAGKTTLVRGVLRALGISGAVRSPTYTILEIYSTPTLELAHLDLYRIASATELEDLGLRDLLEPGHVLMIEWAEKGRGVLPTVDLEIHIDFIEEGRQVRLISRSQAGGLLLARFRGAAAEPEL